MTLKLAFCEFLNFENPLSQSKVTDHYKNCNINLCNFRSDILQNLLYSIMATKCSQIPQNYLDFIMMSTPFLQYSDSH